MKYAHRKTRGGGGVGFPTRKAFNSSSHFSAWHLREALKWRRSRTKDPSRVSKCHV